ELHRTKPKVLLLRKARRKRGYRLDKRKRLGMTPHKPLYLRWIALRHAPQKLQKLLPRSRRKSIDRVRHDVRVHMLCKIEPDRHAPRIRIRIVVGNQRNSRPIRKPHRHWSRSLHSMLRTRQRRCRTRRCKRAPQQNALGMDRPESGMRPEHGFELLQ